LLISRVVSAIALLAGLTLPLLGSSQSGKVREIDRPFSVATPPAHPFVSAKGRFSIDLPERFTDSRPIKIESPGETITGESFDWDAVEGKFTVTYIDTPALISGNLAARMGLDRFRQQTLTQIGRSKGAVISDKDITVSGVAGAEIRADMPGFIYTFCGCNTPHRSYQWMVAAPKKSGADPAIIDRVMSSFKLLDENGDRH